MVAKVFSGKVVIVTGSSNGIGRSTARQFAEQGAKVTIHGRNEKTLNETKQLLLKAGSREDYIYEVLGEIVDKSVADKLINGTVEKFGRIDVLVNNAGGSTNEGKCGFDIPLEDYDYIMNLNVRSVLVLSTLALPHLEKTKGAVINISSNAARLLAYDGGNPYYSISKAALDSLTTHLANTFIQKGIRVNSVNPGMVLTNVFEKFGINESALSKMENHIQGNRELIPLGRIGIPDDIASIIVFLADNNKSEYIVGQCITADGGTTMHNPFFSYVFAKPKSAL